MYESKKRVAKPAQRARTIGLPSDALGPIAGDRVAAFQRQLEAVAAATSRSNNLLVELPAEGAVRFRGLVHRGALRPALKMTSLKLGRVVQSESVLENDLAVIMDACPAIDCFAEQPFQIKYRLGEAWTHHVPDFAVLIGDQLALVEVKFDKDVDEEVLTRTRHLHTVLLPLGIRYVLLTERHIRCGAALRNAWRVLRRARHAACAVELTSTLERLRQCGDLPLSAFDWGRSGSTRAACVARLIVTGDVEAVGDGLMTDDSLIRAKSTAQTKEGASWLLAVSV